MTEKLKKKKSKIPSGKNDYGNSDCFFISCNNVAVD